MKAFWNNRYDEEAYAYGLSPNIFFKEQLDLLPIGSILLPAEGEGRNAIYALNVGWEVTAFDFSESAMRKAKTLAESQGLNIDYQVADVLTFETDKRFDVLGLSYAHFPSTIRAMANKNLLHFVKPNGKVIFEAFSKEQLGKPSGGPKNEEMLFSTEEIKNEFKGLEFQILEKKTIQLNEGIYHSGEASVIRFLGNKV